MLGSLPCPIETKMSGALPCRRLKRKVLCLVIKATKMLGALPYRKNDKNVGFSALS